MCHREPSPLTRQEAAAFAAASLFSPVLQEKMISIVAILQGFSTYSASGHWISMLVISVIGSAE